VKKLFTLLAMLGALEEDDDEVVLDELELDKLELEEL